MGTLKWYESVSKGVSFKQDFLFMQRERKDEARWSHNDSTCENFGIL